MRDAILDFARQFAFDPVVQNPDDFARRGTCIVAGMGGSHLAADLILGWKPALDLVVHSDYGLPALGGQRLKNSFVIASSYSGNTEETLDAYASARAKGMPVAVIATGGKLLERAIADNVPFVRLISTGIQPRSAIGLSLKALLALLGEREGLGAVSRLATALDPSQIEEDGKTFASRLEGRIPLIYTSLRNRAVGYIWKIKFNETGKIPAFFNLIPEANHNEMTGFDAGESAKNSPVRFYAVFLRDSEDDARIQRRMEIMGDIYQKRGVPQEQVSFTGDNRFERMFFSVILADWAALHTAELNGADPDQVPLVEEFKKRMAE